MELSLAQNIRTFRKQRRLTQEQLAEVLGVTTGAVYKWESGLSVPELNLIVEMADFFDTSVDVLLGYQMKDNRLTATIQRLGEYCRIRDPQALNEAEKALKKYPNSFKVVHCCAGVYLLFGSAGRDREKLGRAVELLEQAHLLISQNSTPEIGELTLYGNMASALFLMGEQEKGIELMKKHNQGGMFCDQIATHLAIYSDDPEKAEPFLTEALLDGIATLINAIGGYTFLFCSRGREQTAQEILLWGSELLRGLKSENSFDGLDNSYAILLAMLAHTQRKTGDADGARSSLQQAAEIARRFDAAPDYSIGSIRFTAFPIPVSVQTGLGMTTAESIENVLKMLKDPELSVLWKELIGHE